MDDCPLYDLAPERPDPIYPPPHATLDSGADAAASLLALLASPNIASRRPLFEQYDSIVQSRTVRRPEQADAAVLALPGGAALAVEHRLQRQARRRPTPTAALWRRCSSAPPTSRAWAPSRSAPPTT